MIYFDQFVEGTPKAQPRAKASRRGKHIVMYNPSTADKWKLDIKNAVSGLQLEGVPVGMVINIYLPRPKSHYGRRNKQPYLKPSAPHHHTQKPDVDNLAKAILDAISDAGAWGDDKQVTYLKITKEWHTVGGADILIFDTTK